MPATLQASLDCSYSHILRTPANASLRTRLILVHALHLPGLKPASKPNRVDAQADPCLAHAKRSHSHVSMMELKSKRHIDFQKVLILPVLLSAMFATNAWASPTAWVYLSMHATYGLLWCTKSYIFPDKNFEKPIPWLSAILFVHLPLAVFLVPAVLFVMRRQEAPVPAMAAALMMYIWGMFFHFVSDSESRTCCDRAAACLLLGWSDSMQLTTAESLQWTTMPHAHTRTAGPQVPPATWV
jgi:hypothetical protein